MNPAKIYSNLKSGTSAEVLAKENGIHRRTVYKIAKRYALKEGLAWPVNRNETHEEISEYQRSDYPQFKEEIRRLKRDNKVVRMLALHDVHIPNDDKKAINVALKVGNDLGINIVNDFSDVFEFESYGRWESLPEREVRDELKKYLRLHEQLRGQINSALNNPLSVAIMGNHDQRLFGFLGKKSPQTKSLVLDSFVEKVRKTGTLFLGERVKTIEIEDLIWTHGKFSGENAAKKHFSKMGLAHKVTLCGHLHRLQSFATTVRKNDKPYIFQSYVTGCLCNLNPVYSVDEDNQDWQHGFAIVDWHTTYNTLFVQNVLINERYEVVIGNRYYKAD